MCYVVDLPSGHAHGENDFVLVLAWVVFDRLRDRLKKLDENIFVSAVRKLCEGPGRKLIVFHSVNQIVK